MRNLVLGAALTATFLSQGVALAQPAPPPRYDDRYDRGSYDGRGATDMDAAQRRFDAAQSRYDRERDIYERERQAYDDARARYDEDQRRYAAANAYTGPTWRGNDGQTYCRKKDGTVGTIIGGVAGALLGRAIDGGRRSAVGTLLGGGAGALAGRSIEQNSVPAECR